MTDDIDRRVRTVIAEVFDLDPDRVDDKTSTDTVEAWDSLQHLSLVLALEEEFGIHFDDEETVSLVNYPLIAEIVHGHCGDGESR